jgi:hypothetical protein
MGLSYLKSRLPVFGMVLYLWMAKLRYDLQQLRDMDDFSQEVLVIITRQQPSLSPPLEVYESPYSLPQACLLHV